MAKYIFTLRRGWKWDKDPATGSPRDDWADYERSPGYMRPLEGELVVEYDNGVPRLKIGDGISEFSQLPYMSVDSFVLPKTASVRLEPGSWISATDGDDDRYYQVVTVQNAIVTANSKIDLQPSSDDLAVFHEKDLAFVAENWDGQVRVYCVGQVPQNTYNINVTVTEVICNG